MLIFMSVLRDAHLVSAGLLLLGQLLLVAEVDVDLALLLLQVHGLLQTERSCQPHLAPAFNAVIGLGAKEGDAGRRPPSKR